MTSRWTGFLDTDSKKPNGDRKSEFCIADNDDTLNLLEQLGNCLSIPTGQSKAYNRNPMRFAV